MHNMGFYLAGVKYEFKGDDLLCSMLDSLVVENGSKKRSDYVYDVICENKGLYGFFQKHA